MSDKAVEMTGPSRGMTLTMLVIGIVLMLGGQAAHNDFEKHGAESQAWGWQASLAEMGIPLDLGKTFASIGVLLIVFKLIDIFFVKPLQKEINERTTSLANTFSEAEALRNEMTAMKSEYEQRLQATENDARAQIQAQIKEAQDLRGRMTAEATAKADDIVSRAREDMETERKKIIADTRLYVADLTMMATEKILHENMDNERNRRLVEEFIEKAEVPK